MKQKEKFRRNSHIEARLDRVIGDNYEKFRNMGDHWLRARAKESMKYYQALETQRKEVLYQEFMEFLQMLPSLRVSNGEDL